VLTLDILIAWFPVGCMTETFRDEFLYKVTLGMDNDVSSGTIESSQLSRSKQIAVEPYPISVMEALM